MSPLRHHEVTTRIVDHPPASHCSIRPRPVVRGQELFGLVPLVLLHEHLHDLHGLLGLLHTTVLHDSRPRVLQAEVHAELLLGVVQEALQRLLRHRLEHVVVDVDDLLRPADLALALALDFLFLLLLRLVLDLDDDLGQTSVKRRLPSHSLTSSSMSTSPSSSSTSSSRS